MPFRDVIGHRRLLDLLGKSIDRGTLPPSLLFTGPDGIGKRLVAVAVAQALNCTTRQPGDTDACGTCPSCTRIARNVHADVLLIEPGENGSIKIEQVREIVDRAAYRPFEGRRRVVIVDEADALIVAAQSALLKTLEEPPSASVFILVSSRPDMLLDTVRSRCPRLRFRPLAPGEVATGLVKHGRTEAEARAVAAIADGSLGAALQATGDELVDARDAAVRVLRHVASSDDRRRLDVAKELLPANAKGGAVDREYLAVHLRAMASLIRDVEALGTGAGDATLANPDVRPALEQLSAFRGDRGLQAFEALDRALDALDRNAGTKVVADWVTLNL